MSSRQPPLSASAELALAPQIKRVARLLIAERGVRSVTVREIAVAANQRNRGIVAYYFGTKDKLISEILLDGALRIEARRAEFLRELEANGGPKCVADAVAAIVMPAAAFADEDSLYGSGFNRFLMQISMSNSRLIDRTLEGRGNAGYQRCLTHLRRLTPHLTKAQQSRRLLFLGSYVSGLLAAREAILAETTQTHRMWRSQETLRDIITTGAAMLEAAASMPTAS